MRNYLKDIWDCMGKQIENRIMNKSDKKVAKSLGYHHFQKADALRLHSLFKESIKYYLKCIMVERTNEKAYVGLAMAYKQLKDYDRAIEMLLKAAKLKPESADIEYELGICHILKGCPCKSVMHLRRAIMLDNRNINAQIQLAIAHEMMEEAEIALGIYHAIIEKNPEYISAYNHLASLYMNFEDYASASAVFRRILCINPNHHQSYLGMGICFEKMGKNTMALRYYRKYTELNPESIEHKKIKSKIKNLKSRVVLGVGLSVI